MEITVRVKGSYEIEGAEWARELWEANLPELDSLEITTSGDPEELAIAEILRQVAMEAEAEAIRRAEAKPEFAEELQKANEYGNEDRLGGVTITPKKIEIVVGKAKA